MAETMQEKIARLKARTRQFAKDVRVFAQSVTKNVVTIDDLEQFVRSSGSIAANYLEADDALSERDRLNRMKICRKEARETEFWLDVLHAPLSPEQEKRRIYLHREALELTLIFSAIVRTMVNAKMHK